MEFIYVFPELLFRVSMLKLSFETFPVITKIILPIKTVSQSKNITFRLCSLFVLLLSFSRLTNLLVTDINAQPNMTHRFPLQMLHIGFSRDLGWL